MKKLALIVMIVSIFALGGSTSAEASKSKGSNAAAKRACLKKDPDLSGKALQACIKKQKKPKKKAY